MASCKRGADHGVHRSIADTTLDDDSHRHRALGQCSSSELSAASSSIDERASERVRSADARAVRQSQCCCHSSLLATETPEFQLIKHLGAGSFGEVVHVRKVIDGKDYALKRIRVQNDRDRAAAVDEFRRSVDLRHRYVVRTYDAWQTGQFVYLLLELCELNTLATIVERLVAAHSPAGVHPLQCVDGVATLLTLASQLVEVLCALAERGIVHLDMKPSNVLMTAAYEPRVADFGLSKALGSASLLRGTLGGTPAYMSPEQARRVLGESAHVDARSDVYALGVIIFEMAMLRLPPPCSNGSTRREVLVSIARTPVVVEDYPGLEPVCSLLRQLLVFDAAERLSAAQVRAWMRAGRLWYLDE